MPAIVLLLLSTLCAAPSLTARTVHRCEREGTISLSTAPEPGSRCTAIEVDDTSATLPNLWGSLGTVQGSLSRREQDGRTIYGTRELPGAERVLGFTVQTPRASPARVGLGRIGAPRLDAYADEFRASAAATGVEDAWLRAIAHAESAFDANALSPKGAQGVMQLMPATAAQYGVRDPFASAQSIDAGARHLKYLLGLYEGDLSLVAAAYNAGIGALTKFGGIPPYAETQAYVEKVLLLHARYRDALAAQSRAENGSRTN